MKPSIFFNDMLTKGAILGAIMLLSSIAETAMFCYGGSLAWIYVASVEMLIVTALYIFLLYRFTKNYAGLVLKERKEVPFFSYGNGLAYIVSVSMLAGVIVALGSYMFRHYIIGFEEYIAGTIQTVKNVMNNSEIPASMVGTYDQMFKALEAQDEPSLISSILSGVWSYLVWGTIVGLILAAFTKKEPKIFGNQEEGQNEQ